MTATTMMTPFELSFLRVLLVSCATCRPLTIEEIRPIIGDAFRAWSLEGYGEINDSPERRQEFILYLLR